MKKNVSASKREGRYGPARPILGLSQRQSSLGAHACVQRDSSGGRTQPHAPALVREVLNSPGLPLDAQTRSLMEPRFGYDFSRVRVHTDEAAAASALAVSANAYTANNHIAFGSEKYSPATPTGQSLLAHELTHVIQQARGPVAGTAIEGGLHVSHPADPFEGSANATADNIVSKRRLPIDRPPLTPLQHRVHVPGSEYIQRDGLFGSATTSSDVGAVAGIVGAGLGAAALGLAIYAYLRPPEALNPAPVSGGISINPNPFSFNTVQQTPAMPQVTPVHEPPSNRARFRQAQQQAPHVQKFLDLRTDDNNHAELNVAVRSDGYNIVDASVRTGAMQNYLGGSHGSSATINFSAMQTSPSSVPFDAPEAENTSAGPSSTQSARQSQAGGSAANQAGSTEREGSHQASEPAAVTITFTGTNTKNQDPPQAFVGSFTVDGRGEITVADPEITNGVGRADKAANVAEIDYRAPVTRPGGETSSSQLGSPGGGGSLIPRFDVPNPPILDRPTGIPE